VVKSAPPKHTLVTSGSASAEGKRVQCPRAIVANLAYPTVDECADDNGPRRIDGERVELVTAGKAGEDCVTIGAIGSKQCANCRSRRAQLLPARQDDGVALGASVSLPSRAPYRRAIGRHRSDAGVPPRPS
jgi:hypothetical protein